MRKVLFCLLILALLVSLAPVMSASTSTGPCETGGPPVPEAPWSNCHAGWEPPAPWTHPGPY